MKGKTMQEFINAIPKAELHLHLEGTLEPELMFRLSERNGIKIPFDSVDEIKQAYRFNNLQEFLDIYYQGANVLQTEQDFYDLTILYLEKLHQQNCVYAELMFDPQTHTYRGIDLGVVVKGIVDAQLEAEKKWQLKSKLIFSFLRHLPEEDALKIWELADPYKKFFVAVGLDSSELGNPPEKFRNVFEKARSEGFRIVAHAGEEGPSDYVKGALDLLKADRIDHGNNSLQDDELVEELVLRQVPLTLCPLSNLALKVIDKLEDHPLQEMLQKGLLVTINSDDPAYFGGHLNDNYVRIAEALDLSKKEVVQLAKNSFKGSFLTEEEQAMYFDKIDRFVKD